MLGKWNYTVTNITTTNHEIIKHGAFEVLMAVCRMAVYWKVISCSVVEMYILCTEIQALKMFRV
jgi:hypothetical protein